MDEIQVDFGIWENRFRALNKTIDDTLRQEMFTPPGGEPYWYLLKRLQAFGRGQFNFFFDGFGAQERYKLVRSRSFHPDYVFKVTLDQISIDLAVIQQVAYQRTTGSDEMKQALAIADKLAQKALRPLVDPDGSGTDQAIAVLTYFEKSPAIRVIPYAPLALIGIPFTARSLLRDYLTIAHEVGHYVYRHKQLEDGQSIPRMLSWCLLEMGCPKWVRNWREEIFADVYGCLVGGPVMALAAQDLVLQASLTPLRETEKDFRIYGEFTEDNGTHPIGAVRPYTYTTVLEQMDLEDLAGELNSRWEALPRVKEVTKFKPYYSDYDEEEYVDIGQARKEVQEVTEAVLELLPDPDSDVWSRWSGDPNQEAEEIDQLYSGFVDRLPDLISDVNLSTASLSISDEKLADFWHDWLEQGQFFPGFPTRLQPPSSPIEIEHGTESKLEYLEWAPKYTWNHVLHAGGWATKIDNHADG